MLFVNVHECIRGLFYGKSEWTHEVDVMGKKWAELNKNNLGCKYIDWCAT